MMRKKILPSFILLFLMMFAVACSVKDGNPPISNTSGQQAIKINKEDCVFKSISPSTKIRDILQESGNLPKTEQFSLNTNTTIRVYWNQLSTKEFLLSVKNSNPKLDEELGKSTVLEFIIGPSFGCSDLILDAGEYEVIIENYDQNWIILLEEIEYK